MTRKCPKIRFSDFKAWYWVCPANYHLQKKTIIRFGLGEFRFSLVDTIRYRLWKIIETQRRHTRRDKEQVRLLLSYVKRDIEAFENETRKELNRLG